MPTSACPPLRRRDGRASPWHGPPVARPSTDRPSGPARSAATATLPPSPAAPPARPVVRPGRSRAQRADQHRLSGPARRDGVHNGAHPRCRHQHSQLCARQDLALQRSTPRPSAANGTRIEVRRCHEGGFRYEKSGSGRAAAHRATATHRRNATSNHDIYFLGRSAAWAARPTTSPGGISQIEG